MSEKPRRRFNEPEPKPAAAPAALNVQVAGLPNMDEVLAGVGELVQGIAALGDVFKQQCAAAEATNQLLTEQNALLKRQNEILLAPTVATREGDKIVSAKKELGNGNV